MFGIYFEVLFSGRQIFILICTFFVGLFVGDSRMGFFVKLLLTLPILFIQAVMSHDSVYVRSMLDFMRTGAGGPEIENAYLLLLLTHPVLYFFWWIVGTCGRAQADHDRNIRVEQMTVEDLKREMTIIAAHPEISASGWIAQSWLPMTDAQRLTWVERHIERLRALWIETEEDPLQVIGTDLPQRLAAFDLIDAGNTGQVVAEPPSAPFSGPSRD